VTGLGVVGCHCAWCGRPAVCELEIQAAQYRMVGRVDPIIGDRSAYQRLVHAAIVVAVCDTHQQITRGQHPPVAVSCPRQASEVEQLGLFAVGADARLRNALDREIDG
jgi:hypothetical protein